MPEKVFMYISSIATVGMITIWTIILVAQYKFRRSKTQAEVDKLKFKLPFWPYSIYFTLGFMAMVCLLMAFMGRNPYSPICCTSLVCGTLPWVQASAYK